MCLTTLCAVVGIILFCTVCQTIWCSQLDYCLGMMLKSSGPVKAIAIYVTEFSSPVVDLFSLIDNLPFHCGRVVLPCRNWTFRPLLEPLMKLWNCTHFRHPTDEQLHYRYSNYYNLQSVHFDLILYILSLCIRYLKGI